MTERTRDLGRVKLVQLQPSGLIIESGTARIYDASRRVEVDKLLITSLGVESTTPQGERVLDIHHMNHPDKAYDSRDLVSLGFTSHYDAMRKRFGEHMVNGVAGENIIVACDQEVWMEDIGQQVAIESAKTGDRALLDVVEFAAPCEEFSHFVTDRQGERLSPDEVKTTLQFLNNGRRGFLLVLSDGQEKVTVEPGDRVVAIYKNG
jgi:MOSC domain-containing protein YiiM